MIDNELKAKIYLWFRDTPEIEYVKKYLEADNINEIRQLIDDQLQEIFYSLCKEITNEQDILSHNKIVQKITDLNIIDQQIMDIIDGQLNRRLLVETSSKF